MEQKNFIIYVIFFLLGLCSLPEGIVLIIGVVLVFIGDLMCDIIIEKGKQKEKQIEKEKQEKEKLIELEQKSKQIEQENKNKEIKEKYLDQAKQVAKQRHAPKTILNYEIRGWRKAETYEESGELIYDIYFDGIHKEVRYSPFKALIKEKDQYAVVNNDDVPAALCFILAEYNILEDYPQYFKYNTEHHKLIENIKKKTGRIILYWIGGKKNYLCTCKIRFVDADKSSENGPCHFVYKIISEQYEYKQEVFRDSEELIKQEKVSDIIWNNLTEDILGDWFYPDLKEVETALIYDAYEVCNNENIDSFAEYFEDKNELKDFYSRAKKSYELFKATGQWDDLCRKHIEDYAVCEKYIEQHYKTLSLKWNQTHYVDEYGQIIDKGWEKAIKYFTKNVIKNEYISMEQFNKIYDIVSNRHKDEKEQTTIDLKTGVDFEHYIENILKDADFDVIRTPTTGDQGVDLIAEKEGTKIAIQCKFYSKPVGNKAVQEVVAGATYYDCNVGCVVSNNTYTPAARKLANTSHVILVSDKNIVDQLNEIVKHL